ncbi:MAG: hypothetical protein WBX02_16180, partial [Terriglobales bacterium]
IRNLLRHVEKMKSSAFSVQTVKIAAISFIIFLLPINRPDYCRKQAITLRTPPRAIGFQSDSLFKGCKISAATLRRQKKRPQPGRALHPALKKAAAARARKT